MEKTIHESIDNAIDIVRDLIESAMKNDIANLEDDLDTLVKYCDILHEFRTVEKNGRQCLDLKLVEYTNFQP